MGEGDPAQLTLTQYDHGTDVWATPVVETQLDETVTGGAKIGDRSRNAFLAGSVTDAQARFNVNTLVQPDGQPSTPHMAAMTKLMSLLGLPESLVAAGPRAGSSGPVRRRWTTRASRPRRSA